MTHFIKLLESWEDNKKGDVVEVGKSQANLLVTTNMGFRTSDPSKFPDVIKKKRRGRPPKKKLWGI